MVMKTTKAPAGVAVDIVTVEQASIEIGILGKTPLICNAMSEKAKHELLMPKGRKTAADKAANLKHNPLKEYKNSVYTRKDGPTHICVPSTMFKAAMRNAAVDLPGSSKAQIGRLTYVQEDYTPVYGIPQMMMSIVRSADMNRTPDVRTRVIIPHWACVIRVTYIATLLKEKSVINLLGAAGLMQGIGDWRPEKGKGDYGQFEIVPASDAKHKLILETGGKEAQLDAMDNPEFYDSETGRLYEWFKEEAKSRGFKEAV